MVKGMPSAAESGEVPSQTVGERVMARLRDIDEVAYIRFASEYYKFRSVDELKKQLELLDGRVRDVKDQQKLFDDAPQQPATAAKRP